MSESTASGDRIQIAQADLNHILSSHERFVQRRGGQRATLKGVNLEGAILANRLLNEADFSGSSLVGANLYGSSLMRANLYCTDLRHCNLRNTKLTDADIRGACFKGADLSHAILDCADLRSATMMFVNSQTISIVDHVSDGEGFSGVDFSNCSLRHTSFSKAQLDGVNFNGALLLGTNFRGAKLTDAKFVGAVLMGINLAELNVPRDAFVDCVFDIQPDARARINVIKAKLERHQEWVASDGKTGAAAVLDGEDLRVVFDQFSGRSLVGLSARGAIAIGVDFSSCQLQGARFDGADLRGASFTEADLSGASFHAAKLIHARFEKARLSTLQLHTGQSLPPNLLGAEATREQFEGAIIDQDLAALGLACGTTVEVAA